MNQRSMAVLKQLIQQDAYISVSKLSTIFNVSRRSIYNDLEKVNDWLKEHGFEAIKQVRSEGIYLDDQTKQEIIKKYTLMEDSYYEYSAGERRAWIYIHITSSSQAYFIEDLKELLQVSRNTILEDIKKLKREIGEYALQLSSERGEGYYITGNESDVRNLLIHYLSIVTPNDGWYSLMDEIPPLQTFSIFRMEWLQILHKYLIEYEQQFKIEIIDDVLNNLVIWFHFFMKRMEKGAVIENDPIEKQIIAATEEYVGAKLLCEQLFKRLSNPQALHEEVYYITKYLLSAKVKYNLGPDLANKEMQSLLDVVENMVADFQLYAAVEFDEPDIIIQNLLLHLKPAYYRIKYGIKVENTLVASVKQNYPEVFHITKKVMRHFENLMNQKVDENEIAYIAIHFGGWLRKEGLILEQSPKKLLIVCTNGLGTSRLLESQLEGLFSNIEIQGVTSLREYQQMELTIDFIVSTIALPQRGVPVFVVNPVLNDDDKEQLFKKVNSLFDNGNKQQRYSAETILDIVRRYSSIHNEDALRQELRRYLYAPVHLDNEGGKQSLHELLPPQRIKVMERVDTWEHAVRIAAKPLLYEKYIENHYIEKMIDNIKNSGPYVVISEHFALPHAGPFDGVNKTGFSMLGLREPVNILGKEVRILVILASKDNEQHLKALSQLTRLFSNKKNKNHLTQTMDKSEISHFIRVYSKEN